MIPFQLKNGVFRVSLERAVDQGQSLFSDETGTRFIRRLAKIALQNLQEAILKTRRLSRTVCDSS